MRDGRYWYDKTSGLWGLAGEPTYGQIAPGLEIGGPLRADASAGTTDVIVNGRRLRVEEVQFLSRCMPVIPGRFWMDARGMGGPVGGLATFNVAAACGQAARPRRGGDPWYGSVSGDDGVVGAIFRDGVGVTCGPDGGCIY